jgi:hypothetical protein
MKELTWMRKCDGCGKERIRDCPCGRLYCGDCECDCADWHVVVHEDHEGDYRDCQQPACLELKARPEEGEDGSEL